MSQSWSNIETPPPERLGFLESVLDSMGDAVLVTEAHPVGEPGLKVVYTNEAFTRMTGYTHEETLGESPHILWGEKTDQARLGGIRSALAKREPVRTKLLGYHKNGTEFLAELDTSPITDERVAPPAPCGRYGMLQNASKSTKRLKKPRSKRKYLKKVISFYAPWYRIARTSQPLSGPTARLVTKARRLDGYWGISRRSWSGLTPSPSCIRTTLNWCNVFSSGC